MKSIWVDLIPLNKTYIRIEEIINEGLQKLAVSPPLESAQLSQSAIPSHWSTSVQNWMKFW